MRSSRIGSLGLVLALGIWAGGVSPAAGQAAPPEQPWFTAALSQALESSQVLVVGWSQRGVVGLLVPLDGGGRGSGLRLVVFDAVEDKAILDDDLWPDEFDLGADETGLLVREMSNSEAGQSFLEACFDSGVQPLPAPAAPRGFPLVRNGSSLTAQVLVKRGATDDFGASSLDFSVVLTGPQGQKVLTRGHERSAFEVTVAGWNLSPWEPRALVVYGVSHPGFEGERPITFAFTGGLLTTGFKP